MCFFRKLFRFFRKLPKWLKHLWKDDYDWDWNSLITLIRVKLENMEKFFCSDKTHLVNALETANEIRQTIDLLKKIEEHSFIDDEWEDLWKRWPNVNIFNKDCPKEYQKEAHVLVEKEQLLENRAWFALGWILTHKTRGWWD